MPEIFDFYLKQKNAKSEKEKNVAYNKYIGKRDREQALIDK